MKSPKIEKTKILNEDGVEIKKSHHGKVVKTRIDSTSVPATTKGESMKSPKIEKTKILNEDGDEIRKTHHGKVVKTRIDSTSIPAPDPKESVKKAPKIIKTEIQTGLQKLDKEHKV